MKEIVAILPAYNEEIAIGTVVLRTKEYVDNVIVVDDGSTDNTSEIAKIAGAEVIKHNSNQGKGAALETGFNAIKDTAVIVTMDSDGQHDPSEIPKLIKPILNGEADIVNGSRYLNGQDKATPFYRRIGQKVLDKATKINTNLHITDSQSGFRAFTKHSLLIFRFRNSDFGIESEMLMDAVNAGLRIKEVDIGVKYDLDGSTKSPILHGLGVLVDIINDMEFNRPLIYFTLPGIIIFLIGTILGLIFFGNYLSHTASLAVAPSAAKSLMPTALAIMLTFAGGFLALTGIILDAIRRMVIQITWQPMKVKNSAEDYIHDKGAHDTQLTSKTSK